MMIENDFQTPSEGGMHDLILAIQKASYQNEVGEEKRQTQLFEDLDLTYNMFRILRFLYIQSGGVEPSTLSSVLYILRSTTTNTLDNLEKRSLIRREPHPTDRRRVVIQLEPLGKEVIQKAMAVSHDYYGRIIANFTPEELEQYLALHTRMAEARDSALRDILAERKQGGN